MAATADEIMRLRRMTGELTTSTYYDSMLASTIEAYPLLDERGEEPYTWDTSTEPPTKETNDNWLPTYDLNAAAAAIWEEKAALLAPDYDFSADGATLQRSGAFRHAMGQAGYYRSKRATGTITQFAEELPTTESWIGNAAEEDD